MNGKEILLTTLRGGEASRTPWVPFTGVHAASLLGMDAQSYLQDSNAIIRGIETARKAYQADGIPVVFDLQIEAEILGCALSWARDAPPSVTSHPLSDAEGGGLGDLPEFRTDAGRFPVVLEAVRGLKESIGAECALYGLVCGPFTLALHLRGEDIFLDMFDEEDEVEALLAYCAGVCEQAAEAYLSAGADVIAVVDPMVSQISADHFTQFVATPLDRVFARVRQKGAVSSLFVCGNATRNLEAMCATGCDNISVDENVDLASLRDHALASGKSFGGNLRLTTVLLMGDETDAAREAVGCMEIGGERSYVLAPGCDLPFDTPQANLEAAARVVQDPYQRDIARQLKATAKKEDYSDVAIPDYSSSDKVIVDVVTLDSATCPPCYYMLKASREAAGEVDSEVEVVEHKIRDREGLAFMQELGVSAIPSICIQGRPAFASLIPDRKKLADAIRAAANA